MYAKNNFFKKYVKVNINDKILMIMSMKIKLKIIEIGHIFQVSHTEY